MGAQMADTLSWSTAPDMIEKYGERVPLGSAITFGDARPYDVA